MRALAFAVFTLLVAGPAVANVPSAYLACQDKAEGAPCRMVGPQFGACVRDTLCEDPPDDDVDVCLLCVDPCWGRADGEACLQTATNEPGVCALQDRCTDKEETSFLECNRCVPGRVGATDPEEGCQAGVGYAAPWLFILLALGWQLRRRRPA
ncbi:MAG: hypothetical protein KC549_10670 [Myxococcales bacterium]|nr:hypothetical protein [Myxococcales bacterium]MCB9545584.1 hypothetical protein [Myxococcales bacterium]